MEDGGCTAVALTVLGILKLEERLNGLRTALGEMSPEHLERVVAHLVEVEDHHRAKLARFVETYTEQVRRMAEEIGALRAALPKMATKK